MVRFFARFLGSIAGPLVRSLIRHDRGGVQRPVIEVLQSAGRLARRAGASKIEPAHISAAIQAEGSVVGEDDKLGAMGLSKESKLAIQEAVEAAGTREAVTIEHLRAALVPS